MALHVQCPQCGGVYQVGDEQAGGTATCPECQTLARIPAVDTPPADSRPAPQQAAPSGPAPVQHHPGYAAWGPASPLMAAEQRVGFHLKLIGVFSLVMSALCLIWGVLVLFASVAIRNEAFPLPPELGQFQDPEAFRQIASVFYMVVGVLSLLTFACLLASGVCVLARRPSARVLGMVAAAISCASLWQCFLYPFCLGLGIYSIVVLYGDDARMLLDHRQRPPDGGFPPAGS